MSKSLLIAAVALALGGFAGQAAASDAFIARTQAVTTSGVDFQDRAAVSSLYSRLRASAEAVCETYSANSLIRQADQACAKKALRDAVRAANRPVLTAMYERDTSRHNRLLAYQDR